MKSIELARKKALEIMTSLHVDIKYIEAFAKKGQVYLFDIYDGAVPTEERKELAQRIKDIEERKTCIVYAVTHEDAPFGELYDFLYVSAYEEDMESMYRCYNASRELHIVYANVWNKTSEWLSEAGSILIHSRKGMIYRLV